LPGKLPVVTVQRRPLLDSGGPILADAVWGYAEFEPLHETVQAVYRARKQKRPSFSTRTRSPRRALAHVLARSSRLTSGGLSSVAKTGRALPTVATNVGVAEPASSAGRGEEATDGENGTSSSTHLPETTRGSIRDVRRGRRPPSLPLRLHGPEVDVLCCHGLRPTPSDVGRSHPDRGMVVYRRAQKFGE
jgi:hypothetical protein